MIKEYKSLSKPTEACKEVGKALLILKEGERGNHSWANAQKMMNNPMQFITDLQRFNNGGKVVEQWQIDMLKPIIERYLHNFDP